jgi:hypothetical protein
MGCDEGWVEMRSGEAQYWLPHGMSLALLGFVPQANLPRD